MPLHNLGGLERALKKKKTDTYEEPDPDEKKIGGYHVPPEDSISYGGYEIPEDEASNPEDEIRKHE